MTRVIKRRQVVLKGATATNKPAGGRSESLKSLKSKCRGLLFKRWNQCVLENNWWRHEKIELCSRVFHHGVFQQFWGELNGSNTIKSRAYCHHFSLLASCSVNLQIFLPCVPKIPKLLRLFDCVDWFCESCGSRDGELIITTNTCSRTDYLTLYCKWVQLGFTDKQWQDDSSFLCLHLPLPLISQQLTWMWKVLNAQTASYLIVP